MPINCRLYKVICTNWDPFNFLENEPKFYFNTDFLPQREETDFILKTSPLRLRKAPAIYVENEKRA